MIELRIDTLAVGGRGVGRFEGQAVFVPYTVPGERVRCRVVRRHKRYLEAEAVAILDASPERTEPPCPVFGECGGCQWQHLPMVRQLEWKERIFREAVTRSLPVGTDCIGPIAASPAAWHYRCRAQVKCRMTPNGFVTGFYRRGSHFVVDIETCPLLMPELNRALADLKRVLATYPHAHRVPQLDLAVDDFGRLSLVVHYLERDTSPLGDCLVSFARAHDCAVHVQQGRKRTLSELVPGPSQAIRPLAEDDLALRFPAGGFVQVNLEQNRRLVADVVAHVGAGRTVLDLYCGIGNFSLPLAQRSVKVQGVESYQPAAAMAALNASANGFSNATFVTAEVDRFLPERWPDGGYDSVVLDPPRSGAHEVARTLASLAPQQVVYISCDPMTLARDLQHLLHNGYRAVSLKPYDMFPQTWHIESVTVLERTG